MIVLGVPFLYMMCVGYAMSILKRGNIFVRRIRKVLSTLLITRILHSAVRRHVQARARFI